IAESQRLTRQPSVSMRTRTSSLYQKVAPSENPGSNRIMDKNVQPACGVCGARVGELRRGRCWGCYLRWSDARQVGTGAACTVCNERRRDHLRLVELWNRSVAMCHNCATRTLKLVPIPRTVEGIRERLERDRRRRDRRGSLREAKVFWEER